MNRQIIITGAGKGLGFCLMKLHIAQGDRVLALELCLTEQLLTLQREHPDLLTVRQCDVSSEESVIQALSEQTSVDILYNVAGVYSFNDKVPLTETNIDRVLWMYNINALGAMRMLKHAASLLHEGSVVLNVTSEAGSIGDCKRTSEYGYCMSKAAANMLGKLFANEYARHGVKVLCMHPGWMRTDMGGEEARQSSQSVSPEESAEIIANVACRPEQVPQGVMYLDHRMNPLPW